MNANNLAFEVRVKLIRNELTQTWLLARLREMGIFSVKSELSSALLGTRTGPKAVKLIEKSYEILCKYENAMYETKSEVS